MRGFCSIVLMLGISGLPVAAQEVGKTAAEPAKAAVPPTGNAATVNGQAITELAVQRGLKRVPPAQQGEARGEIIDYLVDNVLLDQYLQQRRIEVPAKEAARSRQLLLEWDAADGLLHGAIRCPECKSLRRCR